MLMQPPFPFRLPPFLHHQLQFLPLPFSQQPQQGLDFGGGHIGQVYAGSVAWKALGVCQAGLKPYK